MAIQNTKRLLNKMLRGNKKLKNTKRRLKKSQNKDSKKSTMENSK